MAQKIEAVPMKGFAEASADQAMPPKSHKLT